jgi:hypothetical protein
LLRRKDPVRELAAAEVQARGEPRWPLLSAMVMESARERVTGSEMAWPLEREM